ncbi:type VI secretion system Vgr family protein [Paraburkholderia megapolitana]|uniref:type VI secretion system Vgr family protein n=2 Tax=Paraburkholderia TaxID=1822464 RepID=UPI003556BB88
MMNPAASLRALASAALDSNNRPARLSFGTQQRALEQLLVLQRLDITEGLMTGLHGRLTCVSSQADLSEKKFLGVPVSVQIVTDRGQLHAINGIITRFRRGQWDGSLCCYELTVRDALSVMEKRRNSRIFRTMNLPDILQTLLGEWRQRSPALASAFDFDVSGLQSSRYPARELVRQDNETDARFIQRLLRRDGVTFFVKAGTATSQPSSGGGDSTPIHTLVFCDDPMRLPQCAAGTVRYHARDAATEQRDSITYWSWMFELVAGRVERASWDYKQGSVHQSNQATNLDQGTAGNDIAHLLSDSVIDVPHAFDSWNDHDRISHDRMLAHEFQAARIDAISGVRDLAVGSWVQVSEHPILDAQSESDRQFVITSLHHRGDNNLPKDLDDQVMTLLEASRSLFDAHASSSAALPTSSVSNGHADTRYQNTFSCVHRGVPLTPAYEPAVDLPPDHLITAVVVGPDGEEVFVDELGRVRVQIQGLNADDHAHAQGAGTNSNPSDSAPVRVACSLAGAGFGANIPLRVGMEVLLGTVGGDPDRMVIIGVLSSGPNPPATFSHTGNLPGNRYLSGMKSKEIKGSRYGGQLRFDDTPQQISAQLASQHAYSELNLGYLTQPRNNGSGQDRGEGAELRTDAAAALRAAQGILLTTYARTQASGGQLDRDELVQLLSECTELFKSLGDYAGQHGGQTTDLTGQQAIASTFKGWKPGEGQAGTGAGATAGSQALMAFGAQAGSVNLTPKTHVTYAGENIDQVAQKHLQLTGGQHVTVQAGEGVSLFAQQGGVAAIANQGKLLLQAQADEVVVNAQKNAQITSSTGEVLITGKTIRLVAEDGSYVKIGGGITVGSNGAFEAHTASHDFVGPSTDQADRPSFGKDGTDQKFRLHYPGTETADTPHPAPNKPYEITLDDGRVIKGTSDADGLTQLVQSDVMRIANIKVFDQI